MLRNIRILIASAFLASSCLNTAYAQQDLFEIQLKEVIVEQCIKNCNVAQFKTEYAAFQTELQSVQEQLTVLETLQRIAHETKKEKVTDLAKFLTRSASEKYWLFAKLGAQTMGAVSFSIGGIFHLLHICPYCTEDYVEVYFGALLMGGLCGYFARNNYRKAFHQKTIIKQEIIALDEIIACIESAKAPMLPGA